MASDLYGIGICLLASVLRSVPFVNKTDESIHPIINRVLTDKPPDLRQHGVSERLSSVISRLLEKDPAKRPSSATESKSLLEQAANSASSSTVPGTNDPGPGDTVIAPAPPPLATDSGQRPAPTNPGPATGSHPPPASQGHGPPPATAPAPPGGGPVAFPPPRPSPPGGAPAPSGFPSGPVSRGLPPPPGQLHPPGQQRPTANPPPPGGHPPPAQPVPGQAPVGQPPGGLRPPPQSFTSPPGGGGVGQAHPYRAAGRPPTLSSPSSGGDNNDRVRLFALAFGATVVIGGLLLFVLTRLVGDDQSSSDVTTIDEDASAGEESSDPDSSGRNGDADDDDPDQNVSTTTSTTTSTSAPTVSLSPTQPPVAELGPLALPLTVDDTSFGSDAEITPDLAGPDSSQFCDNVPVTVGLSEWDGETITHPQGFPLLFQEVVRFDSAAQAQAYTSSFVATVNCDEWTLQGDDGNPDLDIAPEVVQPPAAAHGDENHEITFVGRAEIVDVYARTAIVRIGREVLLLSITSILQNDLTELDSLLDTAVGRLEP